MPGRLEPGYGAGAVIVWGHGRIPTADGRHFGAALEAGHASFWLEGKKSVLSGRVIDEL